jgi:glycerol uptake operon antiterminator
MMTIQRLFAMDSDALKNGISLLLKNPPDMVEVLPGLVYKGIEKLSRALPCPIIAGGMITEAAEVRAALEAGAHGVSSSDAALWGYAPPRSGA